MFVTRPLLLSLGADCCMFLMLLLKLCNYVMCESENGRVLFREAWKSVQKLLDIGLSRVRYWTAGHNI